jgi:hypothetical protein
MSTKQDIYALADIATAAQEKIQIDFKDVDPIVGINRSMRDAGFAADAMVIDCLQNGRRLTFVLRDEEPGNVAYEFGMIKEDPSFEFKHIAFKDLSVEQMYTWVKEYGLDK